MKISNKHFSFSFISSVSIIIFAVGFAFMPVSTIFAAMMDGGVRATIENKNDAEINNSVRVQMMNDDRGQYVNEDANGSTTREEVRANAKVQMETRLRERVNQEIERRTEALNRISNRVELMKKVSDDEKSNVSDIVNFQIENLNNLKAKIEADSDGATLKEDAQSITKSYRIFALVVPQATILAAADRIKIIAEGMVIVGAKLQTRIDTLSQAGEDTSALSALLADYNAKIADAKIQADSAISIASALKPDSGDQTIFEANKKALVDARVKIKAGTDDLKMARKDAGDILKGTIDFGVNAEVSNNNEASSTTEQ